MDLIIWLKNFLHMNKFMQNALLSIIQKVTDLLCYFFGNIKMSTIKIAEMKYS